MPVMTGKRAAVITLGLLTAGCHSVAPGDSVGPGGSAGSGRACLAENARFNDAWACVRARLVARRSGEAARDGLVEEGDLLADQVRKGKVSEPDARKRLEIGLAHDSGS